MSISFRKHWKAIYQAKQNLYGLPFKTSKKKWAWAKTAVQNQAGLYPFKPEQVAESGRVSVKNALPKSIRFLSPIRREFGYVLRIKQATKAGFGFFSEKSFKRSVKSFQFFQGHGK